MPGGILRHIWDNVATRINRAIFHEMPMFLDKGEGGLNSGIVRQTDGGAHAGLVLPLWLYKDKKGVFVLILPGQLV